MLLLVYYKIKIKCPHSTHPAASMLDINNLRPRSCRQVCSNILIWNTLQRSCFSTSSSSMKLALRTLRMSSSHLEPFSSVSNFMENKPSVVKHLLRVHVNAQRFLLEYANIRIYYPSLTYKKNRRPCTPPIPDNCPGDPPQTPRPCPCRTPTSPRRRPKGSSTASCSSSSCTETPWCP